MAVVDDGSAGTGYADALSYAIIAEKELCVFLFSFGLLTFGSYSLLEMIM